MKKLFTNWFRVSVKQKLDYNDKCHDEFFKRIATLENEVQKLRRENDWLHAIRRDDNFCDYAMGPMNLWETSSVIRSICERMGLDIRPPDSRGWTTTEKPKLKK